MCLHLTLLTNLLIISGFLCVSVLLIMRVYALYNRSTRVLVCLVILAVILLVVDTVSILFFPVRFSMPNVICPENSGA